MFQFHTGSIKSDTELIEFARSTGFQFHTGSIKSLETTYLKGYVQQCFNSILVRLKVTEGKRNRRFLLSRFNSILVRLKGSAKVRYILYRTLIGRVKLILIVLIF